MHLMINKIILKIMVIRFILIKGMINFKLDYLIIGPILQIQPIIFNKVHIIDRMVGKVRILGIE